MKLSALLISLIFGVFLSLPLRAGAPLPLAEGSAANAVNSLPQFQYKSLEAYIASEVGRFSASNGNMAVAVATILNSRTQQFFFGETVPGNGKKPDGNTLFLLASISKTFTAALLALAAEKNWVNLDDPLQKHLPQDLTAPLFNNDIKYPITLEMLATHTSGLPFMPVLANYSPHQVSPSEVLSSLELTPLASIPGVKYTYSNFGYAVLGQVLANVEKKPFEDLVLQNISGPLGMLDTKVESQLDSDETGRMAQGNNAAPTVWTFFPGEAPAGGLYSTLNDMVKYLSFALGMTGSSLNSLRPAIFQPKASERPYVKIGLGWDISTLPGTSEQIIWKEGTLIGYKSYIGFLPNKGVGVVFLINSEGVDLVSVAQNALAFLLTDPPQAVPSPEIKPRYPIQILPQGPGPVEIPQYLKGQHSSL